MFFFACRRRHSIFALVTGVSDFCSSYLHPPHRQDAVERHRRAIEDDIVCAAVAGATAIGVPLAVAVAVVIAFADVVAAVFILVGVALLDADLIETVIGLAAERHLGVREHLLHLLADQRVEVGLAARIGFRSEAHTYELQSLMRSSY